MSGRPSSAARAALAALAAAASAAAAADLIPTITHGELLRHVAANAKVVFVDAREADEWSEERLPGAVRLPLRAAASAESLRALPRDATLVAYCVKDFRGYEVARALRRAGYAVRVMDDPGLQGWKKAGLPTAGRLPGTGDAQAARSLLAQARR